MDESESVKCNISNVDINQEDGQDTDLPKTVAAVNNDGSQFQIVPEKIVSEGTTQMIDSSFDVQSCNEKPESQLQESLPSHCELESKDSVNDSNNPPTTTTVMEIEENELQTSSASTTNIKGKDDTPPILNDVHEEKAIDESNDLENNNNEMIIESSLVDNSQKVQEESVNDEGVQDSCSPSSTCTVIKDNNQLHLQTSTSTTNKEEALHVPSPGTESNDSDKQESNGTKHDENIHSTNIPMVVVKEEPVDLDYFDYRSKSVLVAYSDSEGGSNHKSDDSLSESDSDSDFQPKNMMGWGVGVPHSESGEDLNDDDVEEEMDGDEAVKKGEQKKSESINEKEGLKQKPKDGRLRGQGELFPEELPPLDYLNISASEEIKLEPLGTITGIVDILVVIKSVQATPALYDDSVLFLEDRNPLGLVFETFGTVDTPFYSVRFNSKEDIVNKGINIGDNVMYAPTASNLTKFVFISELRKMTYNDASWENDQEVPPEHREYSDDEAEKIAKKHKRYGEVLAKRREWRETRRAERKGEKQAKRAGQGSGQTSEGSGETIDLVGDGEEDGVTISNADNDKRMNGIDNNKEEDKKKRRRRSLKRPNMPGNEMQQQFTLPNGSALPQGHMNRNPFGNRPADGQHRNASRQAGSQGKSNHHQYANHNNRKQQQTTNNYTTPTKQTWNTKQQTSSFGGQPSWQNAANQQQQQQLFGQHSASTGFNFRPPTFGPRYSNSNTMPPPPQFSANRSYNNTAQQSPHFNHQQPNSNAFQMSFSSNMPPSSPSPTPPRPSPSPTPTNSLFGIPGGMNANQPTSSFPGGMNANQHGTSPFAVQSQTPMNSLFQMPNQHQQSTPQQIPFSTQNTTSSIFQMRNMNPSHHQPTAPSQQLTTSPYNNPMHFAPQQTTPTLPMQAAPLAPIAASPFQLTFNASIPPPRMPTNPYPTPSINSVPTSQAPNNAPNNFQFPSHSQPQQEY